MAQHLAWRGRTSGPQLACANQQHPPRRVRPHPTPPADCGRRRPLQVFTRRFFLVDALSGRKQGADAGTPPDVVRFASRVSLQLRVSEADPSQMLPPVLTIEYKEALTNGGSGAATSVRAYFEASYSMDLLQYWNTVSILLVRAPMPPRAPAGAAPACSALQRSALAAAPPLPCSAAPPSTRSPSSALPPHLRPALIARSASLFLSRARVHRPRPFTSHRLL